MITITVNPDGSGRLSGEEGEQRVNAGSVSQARAELLRLVASIAAKKGSSVTVAAIDENGKQFISVDAFGAVVLLDEASVLREHDESFSSGPMVEGGIEPPTLLPEESTSTSESSLASKVGEAADPVVYSHQSPFVSDPEEHSPFDSQILNVDEPEVRSDHLDTSGTYEVDAQPPRIYPKRTQAALSASSPYRVVSPQATSPDDHERLDVDLDRLSHTSVPSESTSESTPSNIIDYSSLLGVDGRDQDDSEIDPDALTSDSDDDSGNADEDVQGSAFRMDLSVFGSPGVEDQPVDSGDNQSSSPDIFATHDDVDAPSNSLSGSRGELGVAEMRSADPEGVNPFAADSSMFETPVTAPEFSEGEFNGSTVSTRPGGKYSPAPTDDHVAASVGNNAVTSPPYGADLSEAMAGRKTSSSFLAPNSTDGPRLSGWRGVARKFGLKVSPSAADRRRWQDEQLISQRWLGTRTVAILNGKGGASKTPTAILLASCFARYGSGGVVVADGNVTRGTLGWRTEQGPHQSTVLDLVPSIDRLLSPSAHYGDVSAFTHHQSIDHFDVLRSNPLLLSTQQKLTPYQLDGVQEVLKKYYRMIIWDTGNDEGDDLWLRIVGHADQIVIATTTRSDHAEAGRLLLDGLAARSQRGAELSRNAVVVVSQADKSEAKPDSLVEGFSARAREVVTIPYDTGMREQWLRSTELAPNTREAWVHAAAAVARGL